MHVALCVNVGSYFINWCRDWLRCLDAWMQRGKVCYGNKNILSLGGESGCLNEVSYNHERGLSHELINFEPSPEFLSSLKLTKKFYPLTKREVDNFNDTVFSRFTSHFSLKSAAFTLAEVLITLGIIGVVAAMTLPSLIASYQEKVIVVQAKKSYSGFLNTLNRMKADEDIVDYSGIFSTTETSLQKIENIAKYYNGAKVCTTGAQGCGSSYLVKLASPRNNGSGSISREGIGFPRILLLDGSLIYFRNLRSSCEPFTYVTNVRDDKGFFTGETTSVVDKRCATVVFDVNGEKKGPNQYGADVHQVLVFPEKLSFGDANYGALKTIFEKDKLQYTKYSDSMTFDR